MHEAADIVDFLNRYVAECDCAGVEPLPTRELVALLKMVAGTRVEPSALPPFPAGHS
jgi:hypothetical protein